MTQKSLTIRVENLESAVSELARLPRQMEDLSSQFLQLREDVREEISGVHGAMATMRDELRAEVTTTRNELRGEMTMTRDALRGEMTTMRDVLRGEMTTTRDVLRGEMTTMREELCGEMTSMRDELRGELGQVQMELAGALLSTEKKLLLRCGPCTRPGTADRLDWRDSPGCRGARCCEPAASAAGAQATVRQCRAPRTPRRVISAAQSTTREGAPRPPRRVAADLQERARTAFRVVPVRGRPPVSSAGRRHRRNPVRPVHAHHRRACVAAPTASLASASTEAVHDLRHRNYGRVAALNRLTVHMPDVEAALDDRRNGSNGAGVLDIMTSMSSVRDDSAGRCTWSWLSGVRGRRRVPTTQAGARG